MAEEKELDFMGMLQSDPQFLAIQQRKAIAQALQQAVLKAAAAGTQPRHPLAVGLDFLTARDAKGKLTAAQGEQGALFRQHREAEQSGLQELLAAQQGGDESAVYRHMASQYPSLKKLAEAMNRDRGSTFNQTLSSFGDRLDPASALTGNRDVRGLRVAPPAEPPQLMSQDGVRWLQRRDRKGDYQVNTIPVPAIGSLNLGEKKVGWETLEAQAKEYVSGKTYEKAQGLHNQMAATQDLLRSLNQNPQMGAGANAFQLARKWLETLTGKPVELTGDTEQMKSQLALNVLTALGGLGVGISNDDRKVIMDAVGSLDADPRGLRRVLLVNLKNQMVALRQMGERATALEKHPAFKEQGINLSAPYAFHAPLEQRDADDMAEILQGKVPLLRPPSVQNPGSRIRPR